MKKIVCLMLVTGFSLAGCSQPSDGNNNTGKKESDGSPGESSQDVVKESREALSAIRSRLDEESREVAQTLEKRLRQAEEDLQEIQETIKKRTVESREKAREMREELQPKIHKLEQELRDAGERSGDAWEEFQKSLSSALSELKEGFRGASDELTADDEEKATETQQGE